MTTIEEVYLRNGLNDLGTTVADLGLTQITQTYVVGGTPQTAFTLSHTPSSDFTPVISVGGELQAVSYTVVGTTLTLGSSVSNVTVTIRYWY